jgi:hypothetical protein
MTGTKKIPRDWSELLALLNSENAEFLVVGAYAMAAHGHERYTKDLDLWLAPTAENASRLGTVLDAFGFAELSPSVDEWTKESAMIQLGSEPYRVDLLNFASGLVFSEAWQSSVTGNLGGTEVHCLNRTMLVKNKLASGRLKDFADAETLAPERADEIRKALAKMLSEKT